MISTIELMTEGECKIQEQMTDDFTSFVVKKEKIEHIQMKSEELFLELSPFEKLLKEAEKRLDCMKEEHQQLKLDEAYKKLERLEAMETNLSDEEAQRFKEFLHKEEVHIQNIKDEYKYLQKIMKEMDKGDGWIEETNGAYQILYKKAPNSPLLTIRMEAEVDVPLMNMITLINEIHLWPVWVPFLKKSEERKTIHKGAKIYYLEFGLPYPLSNRDMYIYGMGINRLMENGTVLIMAKTVDHDQAFLKKHNVHHVQNSKNVAMEISLGGFEITPLGPNKIKFVGIANANPNVSFVPDSMINFVIRKGAGLLFKMIVKNAKNFKGSVWEKEVAKPEKKEFYDWLQGCVEEYFQKSGI